MQDLGLTHIALEVSDMDKSLAFYERYANMTLVFRREVPEDEIREVSMISDLTRRFAIVLMETPEGVPQRSMPLAHLGVACRSREEVDRLCERAKAEQILKDGPTDTGPPVGYWALLSDPDGHTLELAHGQVIEIVLEKFAENRGTPIPA